MDEKYTKSRISLFTRINLIIVLVAALCMMVGAFLLIKYTVQPSIEKDRLLNRECFNSLTEAVQSKYDLVYSQSNLMLSDGHTASRMSTPPAQRDIVVDFEDSLFLDSYIDSVFTADPDLLDIIIASTDGSYSIARSSSNARILQPRYDYLSLPASLAVSKSSKPIIAIRDDEQPYTSTVTEPVVTFAIRVVNPASMSIRSTSAIALFNYPLSAFDKTYRQYGALNSSDLYVINNLGHMLYSNNPEGYKDSFQLPDTSEAEIETADIGSSGIRVLSCLPLSLVHEATMSLIMTMLKVLVPCILIILLFVIILNNKYKQRIQDLADSMEDVSTKGLSTRIVIRHNDELGRLSHQFNKMCDDLENYIDLHYNAELARQTAELNALQAQIDPHFLFNTIESIRMRAIDDGASDVGDMLERMGTLFRWMIRMDKQVVYMEDEADFVESYLSLQDYRYNYCFEYDFDMADDTLYLGVPKFTLQPIVENALLHGIDRSAADGEIMIKSNKDGEKLILTISDNGNGMDENTLDALRRHIRKEDTSANNFGIGMQNVNSRIRLWFGDDYGLNVESELGKGTVVTVILPAMPKKEMDEYVSHHTH